MVVIGVARGRGRGGRAVPVVVGVVRVLPDHRGALAEPDAQRRQPVPDVGPGGEVPRELGHEPHAGRRQGVPDGDRAPVRVDPGVVVGEAEGVEEGEHLHGERLVDLDQPEVVERQARAGQRALGGGDRAQAHDRRVDAGVREGHHPHPRREAQLGGGVLRGEQARGGAVGERRGRRGGHPAAGPERRRQVPDALERRAGARRLVRRGEAPAALGVAQRDRDEVGVDPAGGERGRVLGLAGHAVRVGALAGQRREAVVQVLGRHAHVERVGAHQALGDEARVRVGVGPHRVAAHVLDAARHGDVLRADADRRGDGRHRGRRAGAHPVDRVPRHRRGQTREHPHGAAQGQALVAGLGGRGEGDLVDPLGRQLGVAAQQLADRLDREVVRAGVRVQAVGPCPAERRADALDEHDRADGGTRACAGHGCLQAGRAGRRCPRARVGAGPDATPRGRRPAPMLLGGNHGLRQDG